MAKMKALARAQEKSVPAPIAGKRAELTEEKAGPQPVARTPVPSSLPPPDGGPSDALAARVLRLPERCPTAAVRARMAIAMQAKVGNARLGRMLRAPASSARPSTKLAVVHPQDPSEKEAEAVPDRVAAGRPASPITPLAATGSRTLSRRGREDEEMVRTQVATGEGKRPDEARPVQTQPTEEENPVPAQLAALRRCRRCPSKVPPTS